MFDDRDIETEIAVCAECAVIGDLVDFTEIGGLLYCTECVFTSV